MDKELEGNKSIIRDMLGKNITRSEIIGLYRSIQECEVSEETFVGYLMVIISNGRPRFPSHYPRVEF